MGAYDVVLGRHVDGRQAELLRARYGQARVYAVTKHNSAVRCFVRMACAPTRRWTVRMRRPRNASAQPRCVAAGKVVEAHPRAGGPRGTAGAVQGRQVSAVFLLTSVSVPTLDVWSTNPDRLPAPRLRPAPRYSTSPCRFNVPDAPWFGSKKPSG